MGNGYGSIGWAVTSNTGSQRFESNHWQTYKFKMYLDTVKSIEKTKIKKKEADNLLLLSTFESCSWLIYLEVPNSLAFAEINLNCKFIWFWCKRWGLLLTKQQKYSLNEWLENVHYKYWENYIQFSIDNVYYSTSIAL